MYRDHGLSFSTISINLKAESKSWSTKPIKRAQSLVLKKLGYRIGEKWNAREFIQKGQISTVEWFRALNRFSHNRIAAGQTNNRTGNKTSVYFSPAPGMIPNLVSVSPIFALSAAIRKSHDRAISRPPPNVWPSRAAMVGMGRLLSSIMAARARDTKGPTSCSCILALSLRSAPAQKIPGNWKQRKIQDYSRTNHILWATLHLSWHSLWLENETVLDVTQTKNPKPS